MYALQWFRHDVPEDLVWTVGRNGHQHPNLGPGQDALE
jgi:hypothetical protein